MTSIAETSSGTLSGYNGELRRGVVWTVLGSQWGDEGKGKLVDILATKADVCARFNGGSNAGHTLVVDGVRYALHLTPCGVLYKNTQNLLGNGLVVHLKTLYEELTGLTQHIPDVWQRVRISSRAHILFDLHQVVDGLQEDEKQKSSSAVGTTRKGIGPCYSSKMSRLGVRAGDLLNWEVFERKLRELYHGYSACWDLSAYDVEKELKSHKHYAKVFAPLISDGVTWLHRQLVQRKRVLVEGANAAMLDIDFGTYPFVTSSTTTVAGVCSGLGLPVQAVKMIVAVVKAYTTRVGEGPFPTELHDEVGKRLLDKGNEYGTTTGRPRRTGWLDVQLLRYSNAINGFMALNVSKLDVLTGIHPLKICVAYRHKTTGALLDPIEMPSCESDYGNCIPEYEEYPGWDESLRGASTFDQLPPNAQTYVLRIEELVGVPVVWIGVGPDRINTIFRPHSSLASLLEGWFGREFAPIGRDEGEEHDHGQDQAQDP